MITKIQSTTEAINLNVKNMEETPIKYAQRKLIERKIVKIIVKEKRSFKKIIFG